MMSLYLWWGCKSAVFSPTWQQYRIKIVTSRVRDRTNPRCKFEQKRTNRFREIRPRRLAARWKIPPFQLWRSNLIGQIEKFRISKNVFFKQDGFSILHRFRPTFFLTFFVAKNNCINFIATPQNLFNVFFASAVFFKKVYLNMLTMFFFAEKKSKKWLFRTKLVFPFSKI